MQTITLSRILMMSCGLAALSAPAFAQTANSGAAVEEVVVTGSRIVKNGFQAPTPVTTLAADALQQRAPSNIPDALNQLPQFRGSSSNSRSVTWNANSPNQGNYLNLRGLGTTRSLILLDGVRVPPTSFAGGVDINTLPQALVQRVDVVTGGASAAYGSDALVGVVNFILDKNFTGIKGSVQGGTSTYGDANSYKATLAAGMPFAGGRGHIEGSVEHYRSLPLASSDRKNGRQQIQYTSAVVNGISTSTTFTGVRFARTTFGGYINNGPLAGYEFLPGGNVAVMPVGAPTTNPTYSVGGGGAYWRDHTLVSGLRTDQAFGRVSYDLTPDINVHAQVSLAESRNSLNTRLDQRFAGANDGLTIFADNAFLQPSVRALLGTTPSFQMSRISYDTPVNYVDTLNDSVNANFGFDGNINAFGRDWKWDANYVYGRNYLRTGVNEFNSRRYYAAVDAARDASGAIVCRVTITNPGLYPGCVPINLFGVGAPSQAAINYVNGRAQYQAINAMQIVAGNISGDLFDLPAGPVSIAFGGEMRKQTLSETSNSDPALAPFVDYTGIRGLPANVQITNFTNIGVAAGKVNVREAYLEAAIPLLKDLPFVKSLDLNLAGRLTHYSTSGRVETWKVGLNYVPFDDLRVRATVSRDITAPTLYQLFQGKQVVANLDIDLHTGASAQYTNEVSGNANLTPEIGSMVVAGMVYSPSWLPGFQASVDGYSLYITDAIGSTNQGQLNRECEASGGAGPQCAFIIRPLPFSNRTPANNMQRVLNSSLNQAKVFQSGLDIETSYRMPLSNLSQGLNGTIEFRGLATILTANRSKANASTATANNLDVGNNARISGSIEANYANGPLTVRLSQRYTGEARRSVTANFTNYNIVPNVAYTDMTANYKFGEGGKYEGFLTIQNLFNKQPPLQADSANPGLQFPTNRALYDVYGRYYTLGIRFRL
jgi:outer membrane receptor protein involved in Fe transport